jgi:hypothetical protein
LTSFARVERILGFTFAKKNDVVSKISTRVGHWILDIDYWLLKEFVYPRNALSSANTGGHHAVFFALSAQLIEQLRRQFSASTTQWVA